ncbi:MAG: hypothetical protein D6812_16405 [Deltaproteobacteria bacterium]|nr:MAG: hypothetical protein D6812_16405 [Deltaproteobacteria bacterium]
MRGEVLSYRSSSWPRRWAPRGTAAMRGGPLGRLGMLVLLLSFGALVGGCRPKAPIMPRFSERDPAKGWEALLREGDAALAQNTPEGWEGALSAYEAAISVNPAAVEACWKGAKAAFLLAFSGDSSERRLHFARRGEGFALRGIEQDPDCAPCHYYLALNLGLHAREAPLEAPTLVKSLIEEGKKAAALDPTFDHAGPYRLLGRVYTQLPPPPASFGDPDLAVGYLERAVELAPDYPPNRLHLAEAQMALEEAEAARTLLVALLTQTEDMPYEGSTLHRKARELLERLDEE